MRDSDKVYKMIKDLNNVNVSLKRLIRQGHIPLKKELKNVERNMKVILSTMEEILNYLCDTTEYGPPRD